MANHREEHVDTKKESRSVFITSVVALVVALVAALVACLLGIVITDILNNQRESRNDVKNLNEMVFKLDAYNSDRDKRVTKLDELYLRLSGRASGLEGLDLSQLTQRIAVLESLSKRPVPVPEVNSVVPVPPPAPVATPSTQVIAPLIPASGRFVSPRENEEVHTVFNYEIELRNPDATRYYYIANRIGGLYWPKARINLRSGVTTYAGTSDEGGSPRNGQFSIVLFEVGTAMHNRISDWWSGTTFPGIQIDGRELASVDVVLRR